MKSKIQVAVVDDHALFRKGIMELFQNTKEFTVSFDASNGQEVLEKLPQYDTDVILLDLKMPVMGGLECLQILHSEYPNIKVLILSMLDDNPFVLKAMKLGARGYLLKNAEPEELFTAVEMVVHKEYYINEKLSISLIKGLAERQQIISSSNDSNELTGDELKVLQFICQGFTTQEISELMFKSLRTIDGYRQRLLDKSKSNNTAALVAWAFRNGLVY